MRDPTPFLSSPPPPHTRRERNEVLPHRRLLTVSSRRIRRSIFIRPPGLSEGGQVVPTVEGHTVVDRVTETGRNTILGQ